MKLDPTERCERAIMNFDRGYNCSQAVALAFADICGVDENTLGKISAPFGGGFCRMREVCGTVSGGMMVIGMLCGYSTPETGEKKAALYRIGQRYARAFSQKMGALRCCELLGKPQGGDSPEPTPRDEAFFRTRPCRRIVGEAARILAELLNDPAEEGQADI